MHRFFLPPAEAEGDLLELSEADSHHARDVLRLRPGEQVTVLDGEGREMLCQVRALATREVTLDVLEWRQWPPPACAFALWQAVPKGGLMEDIVEKATELGASRIAPVLTARCEVRLDAGSAERKVVKWRQAAIAAVKQCGSPWMPQLDAPCSFADALRACDADLRLVASLRETAQLPRDIIQAFQRERGHLPASIALWVGPEGDFTPEELDALVAADAKPFTLGPHVLRCATAAVSALAVFRSELAWRRAPRS